MRTPVSVGVVCGANGAGDTLARAFDQLSQATLRWICDDALRASSIGYGPSTAWTRDFDELLQDEDLDAIAFGSAGLAHHIPRFAPQTGSAAASRILVVVTS